MTHCIVAIECNRNVTHHSISTFISATCHMANLARVCGTLWSFIYYHCIYLTTSSVNNNLHATTLRESASLMDHTLLWLLWPTDMSMLRAMPDNSTWKVKDLLHGLHGHTHTHGQLRQMTIGCFYFCFYVTCLHHITPKFTAWHFWFQHSCSAILTAAPLCLIQSGSRSLLFSFMFYTIYINKKYWLLNLEINVVSSVCVHLEH